MQAPYVSKLHQKNHARADPTNVARRAWSRAASDTDGVPVAGRRHGKKGRAVASRREVAVTGKGGAGSIANNKSRHLAARTYAAIYKKKEEGRWHVYILGGVRLINLSSSNHH